MKGSPGRAEGPVDEYADVVEHSRVFHHVGFFFAFGGARQSTKEEANEQAQIDQITRDRPHGRRWRGRRWRGRRWRGRRWRGRRWRGRRWRGRRWRGRRWRGRRWRGRRWRGPSATARDEAN